MNFWDNIKDSSHLPKLLPIVYITFRLEDIRH